MDYVELYYELVHGVYAFSNNDPKVLTKKTIDYLIDADIPEKTIIRIIEEAPKKDYLSYADLPDWLWENSLLKKDVFYYHKLLQIRSKPPTIDMVTFEVQSVPFFLEMKIKFSLNDLLLYFYNKANTEFSFRDEKKDLGALTHLLAQYDRIDFISSVDFILTLIDHAVSMEYCGTSSLFNLDSRYRSEVYEYLKNRTANAKGNGDSQIIHR